jgi:hypothetical protein
MLRVHLMIGEYEIKCRHVELLARVCVIHGALFRWGEEMLEIDLVAPKETTHSFVQRSHGIVVFTCLGWSCEEHTSDWNCMLSSQCDPLVSNIGICICVVFWESAIGWT